MKKRTLAVFFAVIMLMTIIMPLTAMASSTRYVYTSNGKSLNLRSAPISHANNKIANIPYGAEVTVDSYVNNKTWAYVNYDGRWGYVMTRYLVTKKPAAHHSTTTTNAGTSASHKGEFNGFTEVSYTAAIRPSAPGGFVNLRWAPSKSDAIQARLADGQSVEVISQNASWAQVRVTATGAVGFVMRSFLNTAATGGDS